MASLNLSSLNPPQREAVLHGDGPLLVLAGAGSGKTSTMAYRIAHLISSRHMPGSAILGLSFTNKAATELKERVRKLVRQVSGPRALRGLTIATFHSLCVRLLRAHADRIGYQKDFTILDGNDQNDIIKQILKNIRIDDRKFDTQSILFQIGQAKNKFMSTDEAEQHFLSGKLPQDYAIVTASCFGKYQEQLKVLNAMDFDDLIYNAVTLLESDEEIRRHYNLRFRQILVDEYQDTNPAQFKLLNLLTQINQNICVVGDDDQSIYGWRGADSSHILEFSHQFKGARTITLDQNYRSTPTILNAANDVIANNKHRHPKKLWSDRHQGEPISQIVAEHDRHEAEVVGAELMRISQEMHRPWKDFAILYRSNPQSRLFEEALRLHQIPYKIVGTLSFLERKEIKDILSYWRLVVNPGDDASARRIINWPARGIGKTTLEAVGKYAFDHQLSFTDALGKLDQIETVKASRNYEKNREAAASFLWLLKNLRERLEATPVEPEALSNWAKSSLDMINYRTALEQETDDPVQVERKWDNVVELANSVGQLPVDPDDTPEEAPTGVTVIAEFLARLVLEVQEEEDEKDSNKEKSENKVTLLTLHGSKGLEFPIVFLVGMEDGLLPHQKVIDEATDISEERRLAYVGITRAKDLLILTRAKTRIRWGKVIPRNKSRFLDEIPKDLIVTRDESNTPDYDSEEVRDAHEQKVKNFLSQIRSQITKGT